MVSTPEKRQKTWRPLLRGLSRSVPLFCCCCHTVSAYWFIASMLARAVMADGHGSTAQGTSLAIAPAQKTGALYSTGKNTSKTVVTLHADMGILKNVFARLTNKERNLKVVRSGRGYATNRPFASNGCHTALGCRHSQAALARVPGACPSDCY